MTAPDSGFIPQGMDHKTPRNTSPTNNQAADKKRADALRQNLLKRKQQSRARDGSVVIPKNPEQPHKEK